MTGVLTDKAEMAPNSLKGTVNFSIKGGQLLDFDPMEKIHEKVLQKRDLSEIRFAELTNQLDLDTTTITLHRMEIQSTAFTLFVEGTYDLKKGRRYEFADSAEQPEGKKYGCPACKARAMTARPGSESPSPGKDGGRWEAED